jgi:hypothetical protein
MERVESRSKHSDVREMRLVEDERVYVVDDMAAESTGLGARCTLRRVPIRLRPAMCAPAGRRPPKTPRRMVQSI